MPLTPAQETAIHLHDENLIVVAGAGSGKTFVLVERYLALLAAHPEWQLNALVAITFTQKAAQEMRDRVREHLQKQVDAEGETGEAWANRLAAIDSARIDTIHGLCASILRANAAEAGVDPAFAVLDEIEASMLLDEALDDTFRALHPNDPVLELFSEYGERAVRSELKHLINEDWENLPGNFFALWQQQWFADAQTELARFADWYATSAFANWGYRLPIVEDKLALIWANAADLLFRAFETPDLLQRLAFLTELKTQIVVNVGTMGAWGGKEELQEAKDALRALRERAGATCEVIGAPPGTLDQRAATLLPLWAGLTQRVHGVYRTAKAERGALDFDDLESLSCDLLANEDVRARYLGAEFRHVLVDEFQDTNAAQWSIIQRIADPAMPGCLFVVGDPKQSIYGFRGADVSVFAQVRDLIAERRAPVDLSTSFRTHHLLISCLNALFSRLLIRDEDSPAADYEVMFESGMLANRMEVPCDAPPLELLLLDTEHLKAEGDEELSAREWEAAVIAHRLRELVEVEQRPIFDKRAGVIRPIDYGDVALLFQAMTHVTIYEAALKREGIPYLTVAGKGYYDRQEVWDVLNLLRALDNPADNLALAAVLRSPLFSLSDDALLALRLSVHSSEPLPLWQALRRSSDEAHPQYVPPDEREAVEFARDTLMSLRRMAGRVTIAELLREALERTGYLAVLTGLPDGRRKRGNVEKLLEKAETSGRITLSAFTQYLKDMSENEAREGEAAFDSDGAVQLMTVHKSKGLEFPLVVLVDSSYQRSSGAGDVVRGWSCKVYDAEENKLAPTYAYRRAERIARLRETAERRRLLYVAATRAQDYLMISGQVTAKPGKPLAARGWLNWVLDALDARDLAPENGLLAQAWGDVQISFPPLLAVEMEADEESLVEWNAAAEKDEVLSQLAMPLLAQVPHREDAPARTLAATHIADLGSVLYADADERDFYLDRWRRGVFHDAPSRLDPVRLTSALKLGEIVHRAVREAPRDASDALRERLRRYAWEEGVVDEAENQLAVSSAYELLMRVRRSDVFAWMEGAQAVYRDLPFVCQLGQRTIHGAIDLLMLDANGQWRLVDYKTGWLGTSVTDHDLQEHARRYHLQAGVYGAAVQELVKTAPFVYIHYIRYARTVMIDQSAWTAAAAKLEEYIGEVVDG
jgi:ATP-dependent helicase/nuclease subunit A